jgi:two-component system response regulator AtoC
VDVRFISATNRDLPRAIKEQGFREDLYYRLNVITIHLPPLRERKEDIPLLVDHLVRKLSMEMNREPAQVTPQAMRMFMDYQWPGNVRELENVIERALVIGSGKVIAPADLPLGAVRAPERELPESLREMERLHIQQMLEKTGWKISETARRLEVDRQTLYNKIEKYGLRSAE